MQEVQRKHEAKLAVTASYRDLDVWHRAMGLAEACYRITASFPPHERFGLALQIRRAAVSIPSNIAEGQCRRTTGAYLLHLSIAAGSHAELETQIELSRRLDFLSWGAIETVSEDLDAVGRMLTALVRAIRRKREQAR